MLVFTFVCVSKGATEGQGTESISSIKVSQYFADHLSDFQLVVLDYRESLNQKHNNYPAMTINQTVDTNAPNHNSPSYYLWYFSIFTLTIEKKETNKFINTGKCFQSIES